MAGSASAADDATPATQRGGQKAIEVQLPALVGANAMNRVERPRVLPALYAGNIALQAFDVYSTTHALNLGAVEANPVMQRVVGHLPAFIALKASVAGASIYASERLWREHHRGAAIALMVASNGVMAVVARHNASVIRSSAR